MRASCAQARAFFTDLRILSVIDSIDFRDGLMSNFPLYFRKLYPESRTHHQYG